MTAAIVLGLNDVRYVELAGLIPRRRSFPTASLAYHRSVRLHKVWEV